MNQRLIDAATKALTAHNFETRPHYCQRWVRQVIESVYGDRFDAFSADTALHAGLRWRKSKYNVPLTEGCTQGDLLYKLTGSGGDGHVGIRIMGNMVAENSSVHWDGSDARGRRTLKEFGNFDVIVRLPSL